MHRRFRARLLRFLALTFFAVIALALTAIGAVALSVLMTTDPAGPVRTAAAAIPLRPGLVHPVLVQRTVQAVQSPNSQGSQGSGEIIVYFPRPTTPGDLLVAGVDDGVATSGMQQPQYQFQGWKLGATTIGGETASDGAGAYSTGGLQGAIYFYPDNPGGITDVPVATIAAGTDTALTIVLAEYSHVPAHLFVDSAGSTTSGPTSRTYTQTSEVATTGRTSHAPDLVLALFNNGGNAPDGQRFVTTPGWTVVGADRSANNTDQPLLLDYRVQSEPGVVSETEHYLGGYPIDNCAVIVALR